MSMIKSKEVLEVEMPRIGLVRVSKQPAAHLIEIIRGRSYSIKYLPEYSGKPISLTLPVEDREFEFDQFPPYFDGTLPEGFQLDALLRYTKLDRTDYMGQLLTVGEDLVGNVTVEPVSTLARPNE